MLQRKRQFRVGLFVLTCMTMFVALLSFVVGSTWQTKQHHHLILFEENVKGMVVGSKVNFQGVPIGGVADIRFKEGKTLVEIRIDPQKAVIQDVTRARLDRLLVTGQVTIELEGFEVEGQNLPDGAYIETKANAMQQITTGLPEILNKVDRVLDGVATMLEPAQVERVAKILDNLERASAELPAAIGDMRQLLATLDEGGAETLATARQTLEGLERLEAAGMKVAAEMEGMLSQNRPALRALLLGARDSMRELQALARQLRQAPSSLIYGSDQQELTLPAAPGGTR